MKIEYFFLIIGVLGVVGYFFIWRKSSGSKGIESTPKEKDERVNNVDEREKNEDKNTANVSKAIQEKVKPEEKEPKIVEPIIIVGGIESKDYVLMIQQRGKELVQKEEEKREMNKVGVFKDLTDYVMFYGETEEEGEWNEQTPSEEEDDEEERQGDGSGGSGEEKEVEEEEKRVKTVKEMRKEVQRRLKKNLEEKKKENDKIFDENYRLEKRVA